MRPLFKNLHTTTFKIYMGITIKEYKIYCNSIQNLLTSIVCVAVISSW